MRSVAHSPFTPSALMHSERVRSRLALTLSQGTLNMRCVLAPPKMNTTAFAKAVRAVLTVEWRPQ
jgi:hypothetical protein